MNSLGDFLGRFKSILLAPGALKKPVIESISRIAGIDLESKDIELKDGIIYLKTHSLIKNEIYMRKASILKELEAFLGKKAPKDIR